MWRLTGTCKAGGATNADARPVMTVGDGALDVGAIVGAIVGATEAGPDPTMGLAGWERVTSPREEEMDGEGDGGPNGEGKGSDA